MTQLTETIKRMAKTLTTEELVDMFPELQEGTAEHGEIAVREDDLRTVIVALEALEEAGVLAGVHERTRTTVMESVTRLKTCVVVQTKRVPKAPPAA